MEGIYLHNLIFLYIFNDNTSILAYVLAGWGEYSSCTFPFNVSQDPLMACQPVDLPVLLPLFAFYFPFVTRYPVLLMFLAQVFSMELIIDA